MCERLPVLECSPYSDKEGAGCDSRAAPDSSGRCSDTTREGCSDGGGLFFGRKDNRFKGALALTSLGAFKETRIVVRKVPITLDLVSFWVPIALPVGIFGWVLAAVTGVNLAVGLVRKGLCKVPLKFLVGAHALNKVSEAAGRRPLHLWFRRLRRRFFAQGVTCLAISPSLAFTAGLRRISRPSLSLFWAETPLERVATVVSPPDWAIEVVLMAMCEGSTPSTIRRL